MATASAFLRDYLTIDGDQGAWAQRLERYLAKGLDLGRSVSVPAGISQYVDYVQPVATRSTSGGAEVTVLAHLLESHSGTYRDGGMLAFVVPLARGRRGLAVSALPRPASLPMAGGLAVRRALLAPETAHDVTALARHAVAALFNGDRADLAALGGGTSPQARSLPDGWRAVGITTIQAAGPPEEPTAQVLVRVRPPTSVAEYVVAVLVWLRSGPDGLLVRRVDAGGMP
jgi:Conjugative transposon protein TcpC